MKENIEILPTANTMFHVPYVLGDKVQWRESNVPPHFGAVAGRSCVKAIGYHWKKHAVLFNVIRETQGYAIMINSWSLTTDMCTPRRVPVKVEGDPLGWTSDTVTLQYIKRWLLGEGLYTITGLPPRARKMIYQMLESIEDEHVNSYYPGAKYRLVKHHGRWRVFHDGKVCLDVNHLNQITQGNLYHIAV